MKVLEPVDGSREGNVDSADPGRSDRQDGDSVPVKSHRLGELGIVAQCPQAGGQLLGVPATEVREHGGGVVPERVGLGGSICGKPDGDGAAVPKAYGMRLDPEGETAAAVLAGQSSDRAVHRDGLTGGWCDTDRSERARQQLLGRE
jgi:hypothetical protein